ncbi:MAG: hypothetical protein JNG88_12715 [Phycisphaerales bacterium]|nr:hypothetical protein [Phycisphaerales bacterium]
MLDDGGMRRVWLKGREKIAKRYLIHTAGFNLGLIMRKLTGFGTPRGWADALRAFLARQARSVRQVGRVILRFTLHQLFRNSNAPRGQAA